MTNLKKPKKSPKKCNVKKKKKKKKTLNIFWRQILEKMIVIFKNFQSNFLLLWPKWLILHDFSKLTKKKKKKKKSPKLENPGRSSPA